MTFEIVTQNDLPIKDAKLLGHDKIIESLANFLNSNNMATPLTIAINGQWGSGKTSILNTLPSRLNKDDIKVIFFEAWKYEYANPALALVAEIISNLDKNSLERILRIAGYILSNKFLSSDFDQIVKIFQGEKTLTQNFQDELRVVFGKRLGKGKLLVMIDDLDRCDVENTLQILSLVKLFFSLDNCICLVAVDFERLQQAWRAKYQTTKDEREDKSSEYLDKMFQIKIGIPVPSSSQIKDYLQTLVNKMSDNLLELFVLSSPRNPRAIKRLLNLIAFRSLLLNSDHNYITASVWTLLEAILENKNLVTMYEALQKSGKDLGILFKSGTSWEDMFGQAKGQTTYLDEKKCRDGRLPDFFKITRFIFANIADNNIKDDFGRLYLSTKERIV